jgi:peptidoglycan hydrolase CwlO-like protein
MPRSLSLAIFLCLFAAVSAAAQSPDTSAPSPPTPTQNPAPPADTKKPKKVWTNENLSDANGPLSVVGDSKSAAKTNSSPAKPADAQYIASVRKQLEKLQAQINDADKQITDLNNFSKGEPSPSSGVDLGKGYRREPIDVQVRALQARKKDLQAKIDALLDEARKKGVEPGQLR